ncbi:MAG: hypothetical protein MK209_03915 [Planctomycetes bacterium]|nr:hypothetical protein [Planctomycetota bacterium]
MNIVRWRVLLPVALLLTIVAPALRALPIGMALPDLWLLLAIGCVPARATDRLSYAVRVVLLLGILRASVSAVSLWSCWAGLAAALFLRERAHRHISEESFFLRFLVGALAALPPTALDELEANRLNLERAWTEPLFAVIWISSFWAVVRRPGPRRLRFD